jgi:hypothetical protein
MVRELPDGPSTQLTDSIFLDQPPVVSRSHIVWTRSNSIAGSTAGRGIFVAKPHGVMRKVAW